VALSLSFQENLTFHGSAYSRSTAAYNWEITNIQLNNMMIIPTIKFGIPLLKRKMDVWSLNNESGVMFHLFSQDMLSVRFEEVGKPYIERKRWDKYYYGEFKLARIYWLDKLFIQWEREGFALFGGIEFSNQDIYAKRRSVKIEGVSLDNQLPERLKLSKLIFIGIKFYY
jgi:hypothetical protein